MGFYQKGSEKPRKKSVPWRFIGVVTLSALVGSGATLAMVPVLQTMESQLGTAGVNALSNKSVSSDSNMSANVNVNVNDAITQVVKKVEPDVVAVVNYTTSSDFFSQQSQTQASDIGSGVYFNRDSSNAYIVTNNHVVEGGSKVEIVLQSGKHIKADVVGTDPYTDLAVIKVPSSTFSSISPAEFGNSDTIQVGEPAIAIGTPMGLDFADSVTSGIISGNQRMMPVEEPTDQQVLDYQAVIQTDAAINPGNSGGPLLNIQGQIIGINSSKIVEQDVSGMGFAIPTNEVQAIASEIIQTGHAVHPALGVSGYSLASVPQAYWPNVPVDYGVYVESLVSPEAKSSGLARGDVIIAVNGQTVQTVADLRTALFRTKPGQQVQLMIYRGNRKMNVSVQVGAQESENTTSNSSNSGFGSNGYSSDGGDPFAGSDSFGG